MKKILASLLIIITTLALSSCFFFGRSTIYPDMVEYTEDEVLEVAKSKYGITEWLFTDLRLDGQVLNDSDGNFKVEAYGTQFDVDFPGGDNIEAAMTAFAGKNGGHDIQGRYRYFLSYVALGECSDGSLKFVYYNTNIHKDAEIADTIGAGDYVFDVLPTEIDDSLFSVPPEWFDMTVYMNKHFKGLSPKGFIYSGDRLMRTYNEQYGGLVEAEFYREDGKIVYDLYYTEDEREPSERRLVYSTSDRYGVIYNYYGLDKSRYFDIRQTVTQSPDERNVMVLWGYAEAKEIDGTVLYSSISYNAKYQIMRDGEIIEQISSDSVIDELSFDRGFGMEKIDGVDHAETAKFSLSDFYIFYEKN